LAWWPPFPESNITGYKVVYCRLKSCSSTTTEFTTNRTNAKIPDVPFPDEKYKVVVFGYTGDDEKDDIAKYQATKPWQQRELLLFQIRESK